MRNRNRAWLIKERGVVITKVVKNHEEMDFLSSLKTAYDSIGSEVSKTFDSSGFEGESSGRSKTEPVAVTDSEDTPERKVTSTQHPVIYCSYNDMIQPLRLWPVRSQLSPPLHRRETSRGRDNGKKRPHPLERLTTPTLSGPL